MSERVSNGIGRLPTADDLGWRPQRLEKAPMLVFLASFVLVWGAGYRFVMALGVGDLETLRKILLVTGAGLLAFLSFGNLGSALVGLFVFWSLLPTSWIPMLTVNVGLLHLNAFTLLTLIAFGSASVGSVLKGIRTTWTMAEVFLLSFVGWAALGAIGSPEPGTVLITTLEFACSSWMVFRMARSIPLPQSWLLKAVRTLVITAAGISALAIVETMFLGLPVLMSVPFCRLPAHLFPYGARYELPMRAVATLGNPLALGTYLNMIFPFALFCAAEERGKGRVAAWVAAGLIAGGIIATFSRASLVVLALSLLGVVVAGGVVALRVRRGLLTALVALVGVSIWVVPNPVGRLLVERFSRQSLMSMDIYHRVNSFESSANMVRERPWIGFGMGTTFRENYLRYRAVGTEAIFTFDNWYLALPAMTGVPGLLLFTASLASVLWALGRRARVVGGMREGLAAACFLSALSMVLEAGTMDTFRWDNLSRVFWFISGLGYASIMQQPEDGPK